MSTIINGTTNALTFPDTTVQNTAFTTGAVTQSTIANGVAGTGPAFSAYQSGTQTGVSSGTWTKVQFNTEFFDTNNNFASNTFTPTVAGYYQVNAANYNQLNNSSDALYIRIYKNGSNYGFGVSAVGNNGNYASVCTSSIVYCNGTTDYIEIYSYCTSATNFYQGGFSASLVRAA